MNEFFFNATGFDPAKLRQPVRDTREWLFNPAATANNQLTVTLTVNTGASFFRLAFP